jgi:hypothetical protein
MHHGQVGLLELLWPFEERVVRTDMFLMEDRESCMV